jgi:hypothetical protein
MKLNEFKFSNSDHFVAMEYYGLIFNRTYLVLITREYIIGLKVNGLISIESKPDVVTKLITSSMAVKGDLFNPYSYIKSKYLQLYQHTNLLDGSILKVSRSNFMIKRNEVKEVRYDPSKKWGIGYYPHDGKIYISYPGGKKREFIVLGNQSGKSIADIILLEN